jgi:hypothetical protein
MKQTLTIAAILDTLHKPSGAFPRESIQQLIIRREESACHLLNLFRNPDALYESILQDKSLTPVYALYLLAFFKETTFCPLILRVMEHPRKEYEDFWGDILLENMPSILFSVFDGDTLSLIGFVLNPKIPTVIRNVVLRVLGILYANGRMQRNDLLDVMRKVYELEKNKDPEANFVLAAFCGHVMDLQLVEFVDEAKTLLRDNLRSFASKDEFATAMSMPEQESRTKFLNDHHNQDIRDIEISTAWWVVTPKPAVRAEPKVGRNDPCICDSGKKYKVCCGR